MGGHLSVSYLLFLLLDDTYNFVTCYLFACMLVFTLPLWLHNSMPFIYSSFILIIWSGVLFYIFLNGE